MSDGLTDAWRMSESIKEDRRSRQDIIDQLEKNNREFKTITNDITEVNNKIVNLNFAKNKLQNRLEELIKKERDNK